MPSHTEIELEAKPMSKAKLALDMESLESKRFRSIIGWQRDQSRTTLVALDPEIIMPRLEEYVGEENHETICGIPTELADAMQKAHGERHDWIAAGHAFAACVIDQWPEDVALEGLYAPLDMILSDIDSVGINRDYELNKRVATIWLTARFPDVIASVPKENIHGFVDAAYKKMFVGGYWHNSRVYDAVEAASGA